MDVFDVIPNFVSNSLTVLFWIIQLHAVFDFSLDLLISKVVSQPDPIPLCFKPYFFLILRVMQVVIVLEKRIFKEMIWLKDLWAFEIDTEMLAKSPRVIATSLYAAYPVPKRIICSFLSEHDEFVFIQWPHNKEIIICWSIRTKPFLEPYDNLISVPSNFLLRSYFFNDGWLTLVKNVLEAKLFLFGKKVWINRLAFFPPPFSHQETETSSDFLHVKFMLLSYSNKATWRVSFDNILCPAWSSDVNVKKCSVWEENLATSQLRLFIRW